MQGESAATAKVRSFSGGGDVILAWHGHAILDGVDLSGSSGLSFDPNYDHAAVSVA